MIEGTISPDNLLAFAWREPGKAPTEEPDLYQVESVILQLHDGRPLAISPGNYWDTGGMHANRYDFHAIWSPNSRFVVELLDFRWSTEALRLYSFNQHGTPVLSLDLKPIMELAVRRELRKTMKNEASYAFEIRGDNSGEPPRLSIDNDGMIRARIEMQVPKEDLKTIYVDVLLQVSWRDGALYARPLKAQAAKKFSAIHFLKRRDFVNNCIAQHASAKPKATTGQAAKSQPMTTGQAPKSKQSQ